MSEIMRIGPTGWPRFEGIGIENNTPLTGTYTAIPRVTTNTFITVTSTSTPRLTVNPTTEVGMGVLYPSQTLEVTYPSGVGYTVHNQSNTYLNTPNNMTNQVNVAIFKVTRSEDSQKVISTQFLKQMWVELKRNADLKLVVASKLSKEDLQGADLSELDIRELMTVSF